MDSRTTDESKKDFSDWNIVSPRENLSEWQTVSPTQTENATEEDLSDWHDSSTSDFNDAEPIELDNFSNELKIDIPEKSTPAEEKPLSRKVITAATSTTLSALGMPIFIKLAYEFGKKRINPFFNLSTDAKGFPEICAAATGFSGFIFNVDSWYACFDRLYAAVAEIKKCHDFNDVKDILKKILPENIFTSGAGFVSSIPILDRAYKTFEPEVGKAGASFLISMIATLYIGLGNNYMTKFLDDITWCLKIMRDPIFKKREEIIFFLNKLSSLLTKNNIPLHELEYILNECENEPLEEKVKVLASILRLHNESYSHLGMLDKESLINCASFLFGSLRAGIFLSDTKAGIEGALNIDSGITSTLLTAVSLLPNIASQGNNMRATINALRHLSSCKDVTPTDIAIGVIGILASSSMTEFAFTAGLGTWTIPLALLTALGSLASNTRGMSQLKNRFFKTSPHHPEFSPEKLHEVNALLQTVTQELNQLTLTEPGAIQLISDISNACQTATPPLDEMIPIVTKSDIKHDSATGNVQFSI